VSAPIVVRTVEELKAAPEEYRVAVAKRVISHPSTNSTALRCSTNTAQCSLKAPDWPPTWRDREEVLGQRLLAKPRRAIPSEHFGRRSPSTTEAGEIVHGKAATAASPFESKFRLVSAGRWPLGVARTTLALF
jgi:hypothetical protein